MRAAVTRDTTVRTIELGVEGVPDIDVTTYHRKPRIFRPDRMTITVTDGEVSRVNVSGGLVLKSGKASTEVRENQRWWTTREIQGAPDWVQTLIKEAPAGVTFWRSPSAEEVQEL